MIDRRHFVFGSCAALAGSTLPTATLRAMSGTSFPHLPEARLPGYRAQDGLHIVRPLHGYSPQIGTLVSMANWIRSTVVRAARGLDREELDYLYDSESNTIGALLLHLAALDVFYQVNTFERREFNAAERRRWSAAQDLGDTGRAQIKGHDLDYYLSVLEEVRAKTLAEFQKRDDDWFQESEPFFDNQPTNNFCKWFHVVEHEANHRGQITWLEKRLPGHEFANATRG